MPLTIAETQDDLRFLGGIDRRHSFLEGVPDSWFDNNGYILLSVRDTDGTPLVAVALEYPSPCPLDPTADVQIKLWVANLKRMADLDAAFVRSVIAINDEMERIGAKNVWGMVPKSAGHMIGFLDRVAAAGQCRKVDGATVTFEDRPAGTLRNFNFYIGNRQMVTDFMRGLG